MKINTIYQQGNFEFSQNYSIKTEEKTISKSKFRKSSFIKSKH